MLVGGMLRPRSFLGRLFFVRRSGIGGQFVLESGRRLGAFWEGLRRLRRRDGLGTSGFQIGEFCLERALTLEFMTS